MKKTVFLVLFFVLFSTGTTLNASSEGVYEFTDYEFRLTDISTGNNARGYHITKLGKEPFEVDAIYDNNAIYITNVKEIGDNHVFYGFSYNRISRHDYDAFVLILDQEGNQKFLLLEDLDQLEDVKGVYEMDNVLFIHVQQNIENEIEQFVFNQNLFLTYDYEGNRLNSNVLGTEFERTMSTDDLFLFSYNKSGGYEGAVTSDLIYIYEGDNLDIASGEVFIDEVSIPFLNNAVINDEIVRNGVTIAYPGFYEITYNDFTYSFVVEPSILGVVDGEIYSIAVTPTFKMGNAYLNNDLYVSGTPINKPGNYTLSIYGIGDYVKEIHFSITSNIEGVLNNQTYEDGVKVEFEGEGYLNNTYIESPYTVDDNGEYLLKIKGEGNYLETYYFEIRKPDNEKGFVDFIQKYDVVFLGIVVIGGGLILKKK